MKKFDTEVRLSREMTLVDATLIGVGAMIGAGIFVLTGIAAGVAGPALLLAFVLNGVVALLTAMSYAELGSCYHDAGGGYLWVKEGLPRWNGFLSGWMSWFAHAVACALYALGFGAYFEHVLVELGVTMPHWGFLSPQKLLAVGIAIIFAYINFRGASETGKVGNFVTMTKIAILAVFVAFGLQLIIRRGDVTAGFTPFFAKGFGGVVKAMGLTFIAFQGFEVISQCSEEVKNPRRNIPRAVFYSLLIVVPIYLLVAVVALGSVHPAGMTSWDYLAANKETALVEIAKGFFVGGGVALLVGGLISTMSALNATIYSSSRVAFAMGRDRNFPSLFSKVHIKRFTPHWAILLSVGIVVLMAVSLRIEDVASAADIMFLLLFLQVNLAMIRLRKKRPDLDRGFTVPWFPYLSIAGIVLLVALAGYMITYSPLAWLVTAAWIGLGLLVYRTYASRREVAYLRKLEALDRIERKEYRILVALSNPASIDSVTQLAAAVAKANAAEVIVLHVIEVAADQPLRAGLEEEVRAREFLDAATVQLEQAGVRVRPQLRVSHRISQGIVDTAEEERCNFVVLGRPKGLTFFTRLLSSVIDSVVHRAPCEVAVIHGRLPEQPIRNLLIPFRGSIHTRLAFELAPALVEHFHCQVHVGVVFEPGTTLEERRARRREIDEMVAQSKLGVHVLVVNDSDVRQGVVELSRGMDLLVMAGRSGGFLELLLAGSLTEEITAEAACPVLWIKEYEERPSLWSALFGAIPKAS